MEHFNYNPNIDFGIHTVRITYGVFTGRATYETTVRGNCRGGQIIESAIENFLEDKLSIIEESGGFGDDDDASGVWRYVLPEPDGDTCEGEVYGTATECERAIRDMVIAVEILAYEEDTEEMERQLARRKKRAAQQQVERAAVNGEIITEAEGYERAEKARMELLATFTEESTDDNG